MSRVGLLAIPLPAGVVVSVEPASVSVTGPRGKLSVAYDPSRISIVVEDGSVRVRRKSEARSVRALHGLVRSLLANAVTGVVHGFSGGGLFNEQGELIGLTTFMRNRNPPAFYAIPSSWLIEVSERQAGPVGPLLGRPFWQTDPNFLEGKP